MATRRSWAVRVIAGPTELGRSAVRQDLVRAVVAGRRSPRGSSEDGHVGRLKREAASAISADQRLLQTAESAVSFMSIGRPLSEPSQSALMASGECTFPRRWGRRMILRLVGKRRVVVVRTSLVATPGKGGDHPIHTPSTGGLAPPAVRKLAVIRTLLPDR